MYNLLIVDDKDVFRRRITRMTYFKENQDKFSLQYLARNGLEALEYLNSGDVDIVLTDIRMPLMNGIELLKEINRNKLCRCTILLSEFSDFAYAKEGIVNGAFDYIVKPVDDLKLKESFDRAYHYMQNHMDEMDPLAKCIDRLAGNVAAEESSFLRHLDAVVSQIEKDGTSLPEMQQAVETALEKLNQQILRSDPYIINYVSLSKICTLNVSYTSGAAIAGKEAMQNKEHTESQEFAQNQKANQIKELTQNERATGNKGSIKNEEELLQLFKEKVMELRHTLSRFRCPTKCELVCEVWEYVISDIDHAGSLQTVAEKFYVNNKYLSTLFRKETGVRYTDFITYFKIERAKMLLTDPTLKVYAVSDKLGFRDTEYFSKVFKKLTGVSPSAYCWKSTDSVGLTDRTIR